MILRPLGVFREGRLERGLEVEIDAETGRIESIRSSSARPQPFILSPAFVNAHSHLEYRGLQGAITANEYWPWIRELTLRKGEQSLDDVRRDTVLAARENRATGVALLAEHSDRPFAAEAMREAGLQGRIYQELITFFEQLNPDLKWIAVEAKRLQQERSGVLAEIRVTPHAPYTVDEASLLRFLRAPHFSIHVAETPLETQFFREGQGPITDLYRASGYKQRAKGLTVVEYLDALGLARHGAQFVHCCALESGEAGLLAEKGVSVAHCPRSNLHLGCPHAPVRRLWDAGCMVGIGMDSPASSGPIDMFEEMRAAMEVSVLRGEPLTAEMVWTMATSMGAASIGHSGWEIREGAVVPFILVRAEVADLETILLTGVPEDIQWPVVAA